MIVMSDTVMHTEPLAEGGPLARIQYKFTFLNVEKRSVALDISPCTCLNLSGRSGRQYYHHLDWKSSLSGCHLCPWDGGWN